MKVPDFGLTRLWNGWGVLLPITVFIVGAFVLDQIASSMFDGLWAFAWFGAFFLIAIWTIYHLTGQHQK